MSSVAARRTGAVLAAGPQRLARLSRAYATPATYHQQEADPQLNGYPQLPAISRQRLPAKGWWDPQFRRNYGDTLHEREEMYSMWAPDVPHIAPPTALRWFVTAWGLFAAFGATAYFALTPDMPAVRREYPYDGLHTALGQVDANKARAEPAAQEEEE